MTRGDSSHVDARQLPADHPQAQRLDRDTFSLGMLTSPQRNQQGRVPASHCDRRLADRPPIWQCPGVRRGAALILGSFAFAATAGAHGVPFFWSLDKVMRMTDGVQLRVGKTVVRIDQETTLCAGQGSPRRRNGVRRWRHFLCSYTTRRGLGRDVEFRVHVLGVRRLRITDARWVGS
jgi:hypothetical protein